MLKNILITFLAILMVSCKDKVAKKVSVPKNENLEFHKLSKLFVIGDFDGDKKADTLYEHNFSKLNNREIESAPNPSIVGWDKTVDWFFKQESIVYLSNKEGSQKLYLTVAQGLYCLINIGDNNKDGKDEIALAITLCDFSNLNSCRIYSICNNEWIELNSFRISENAFTFEDEMPVFTNIKEFLEQRNGKWYYMDYLENLNKDKGFGEMYPLKIEKCK